MTSEKGEAAPEKYLGVIARHNTKDPEVVRAVVSYEAQRARCYNKKHPAFKNYGGKGTEVIYGIREFVAWWLREIKSRLVWVRPTCGRINHDGNYAFGNIELVEMCENAREMLRRTNNAASRSRRRPVLIFRDGVQVTSVASIQDAAAFVGCSQSLVSRVLSGERNHTHGFTFKFCNGGTL
jgi:hypothetical protein